MSCSLLSTVARMGAQDHGPDKASPISGQQPALDGLQAQSGQGATRNGSLLDPEVSRDIVCEAESRTSQRWLARKRRMPRICIPPSLVGRQAPACRKPLVLIRLGLPVKDP